MMTRLVPIFIALFFSFQVPISSEQLYFDLETPQIEGEGVTVNFANVEMLGFLRCVGEIAKINFVYNENILNFKVSLFTGKETTPQNLVLMTLELLKQQGITAKREGDNYYLFKGEENDQIAEEKPTLLPVKAQKFNYNGEFHTYSLHFHSGKELRMAIQQMIKRMPDAEKFFPDLLISIESMQWLESTNSFLYSGTKKGIEELSALIEKLDVKTIKQIEGNDFSLIAAAENFPSQTSTPFSSFYYGQKSPEENDFEIYKLQYHPGQGICSAIQQMSNGLQHKERSLDLTSSISSMQWIEATNSILYSGTKKGIGELTKLIQALDVPKKQVFIEVLVIETKLKNSLEFGLEWGSAGKYRNKFGYGVGNFPPSSAKKGSFANTMQQIDQKRTPTGKDVPLGAGFSLGMLGDIILHKGTSYFSLASLVSALQEDGDSTIILNEKVIAQDSKTSTIFTGENLPFAGSKTEINSTSGGSQTTSNIEYRDVGVKLNITPLIGEGDVITLKISQIITEADPLDVANPQNGIRTSKTDMDAQAHVLDRSFVVLSGMMRNHKNKGKSGIPCLGGLPIIGAAFSKTHKNDDKRNIMIFVYPQIIHSDQEHRALTQKQQKRIETQTADPKAVQAAIDSLMMEKKRDEPHQAPPRGDTSSSGADHSSPLKDLSS